MLDISFSELLVILLVALVVLGPEKLHSVIRVAGRWTGKARTYMRNLTDELERETQASELKRQLEDAHRILREQGSKVQDSVHELADQANLKNVIHPKLQTDTDSSAEAQSKPAKSDAATEAPATKAENSNEVTSTADERK